MQLNELRKELRFNGELLQLIDTLKNIAAAQYHTMEREKARFNAFMDAFAGFFRVVNLVDVSDPLADVMTDVHGVVVMTSDSGFMGGLNQKVIRSAAERMRDKPAEHAAYVVIGEKGADVFSDMNVPFKAFPGVHQDSMYEQAVEVKDYLVQEVLARRMGRVSIAYPRPLSFSSQTTEWVDILPCKALFDASAESEVSRRTRGVRIVSEDTRVIVESEYADMLEYLAGVWVTSKLYEVFEDSKLAEFSARAMHLEGSLQKLEKENKKLKHQCFKATHELIDKGMRESFAATGSKKKRRARAAT